ncbi:hypothetical protein Ahy_B10g103036 [Arachis hypogaea]|uniref:Uncharacterized protein n=1 Tax=Arachis hypogaea TaxID=3818 RepID=A0A444X305_ARAHY|nr:hypothetical protein Ahy_B10g103036 [Arachis hypogaea]
MSTPLVEQAPPLSLLPPPPPPPAREVTEQAYTTHSGNGSVGAVIGVVAVITVLGVVAGMIGRICSGRRIMGIGDYDIETWVETKCSSCVDGTIVLRSPPVPPPQVVAPPEINGGGEHVAPVVEETPSREIKEEDPDHDHEDEEDDDDDDDHNEEEEEQQQERQSSHSQHGHESIRMGYNDFGDFYYAHGQLGELEELLTERRGIIDAVVNSLGKSDHGSRILRRGRRLGWITKHKLSRWLLLLTALFSVYFRVCDLKMFIYDGSITAKMESRFPATHSIQEGLNLHSKHEELNLHSIHKELNLQETVSLSEFGKPPPKSKRRKLLLFNILVFSLRIKLTNKKSLFILIIYYFLNKK